MPGIRKARRERGCGLEFGEKIIGPGKPRATRVALSYSISSDLWQPFGYAHMLERRGLYLALIHDHYLVDLLTEEDVLAGRLADYRILYAADPCISADAAGTIGRWVNEGGTLVGTCAAGSRNEFGEQVAGLAEVFGIAPGFQADCQPGEYRERGRLNDIPHRDRIKLNNGEIGVIGVKALVEPRGASTTAVFASDGRPAQLENQFGKGRAIYFAATPGISYIKDAKFVADALAEKWPMAIRQVITHFANESKSAPLVQLSEPVVEAGIFDAHGGSAMVLANFTYRPIASLKVELPSRSGVLAVKSLAKGMLSFESRSAPTLWRDEGYTQVIRFALPLDIDDLVLFETK